MAWVLVVSLKDLTRHRVMLLLSSQMRTLFILVMTLLLRKPRDLLLIRALTVVMKEAVWEASQGRAVP